MLIIINLLHVDVLSSQTKTVSFFIHYKLENCMSRHASGGFLKQNPSRRGAQTRYYYQSKVT